MLSENYFLILKNYMFKTSIPFDHRCYQTAEETSFFEQGSTFYYVPACWLHKPFTVVELPSVCEYRMTFRVALEGWTIDTQTVLGKKLITPPQLNTS